MRRPKGTGGLRNRGTARTPRWFAYYYVTEGEDRTQVTEGPFRRKTDAEQWLNDRIAAMATGRIVASSRITIAEMLDQWLTMTEHRIAANTHDERRRVVESRLVPAIGSIQLAKLRAVDVAAMLHELRQPGSNLRDPSKAISETSIQHIYATLRTAVEWAVRQRLVAVNVVQDVDRPKRESTEMKVWEVADVMSFLDSIQGERLAPLFRLAIFTGMRRSELIGLLWSSVSLSDRTLSVNRRRYRAGAGEMVEAEETKSKRGRRVVELDDETVTCLRRWSTDQKAERLAWGPAYADSGGYVFTREDGRPLHADIVSKTYDRLRRRAPVPRIRFHDLRHTHASLLLARGVPMVDVAHRLGDTPETIMSTYAHLIPGQGRRAADTFAALMEQS